MNLTELRDALDELAGPVEPPTSTDRQEVRRRVGRSRVIRATSAVALALALLAGIVVATNWGGEDRPTHVVTAFGTTVHDEKFGYTVTIPPSWIREPLTVPKDAGIPIILSMNYDYTAPVIGPDCASSVEQTGIHIGIQESRFASSLPRQPIIGPRDQRPAHFGPDSGSGLASDPESPLCHRLLQQIFFHDQGRGFYVAITMAPDTTPARQAEVYEILNSLRFDTTTTVSTGGQGTVVTATTLG